MSETHSFNITATEDNRVHAHLIADSNSYSLVEPYDPANNPPIQVTQAGPGELEVTYERDEPLDVQEAVIYVIPHTADVTARPDCGNPNAPEERLFQFALEDETDYFSDPAPTPGETMHDYLTQKINWTNPTRYPSRMQLNPLGTYHLTHSDGTTGSYDLAYIIHED